jgi:hypothetical protein
MVRLPRRFLYEIALIVRPLTWRRCESQFSVSLPEETEEVRLPVGRLETTVDRQDHSIDKNGVLTCEKRDHTRDLCGNASRDAKYTLSRSSLDLSELRFRNGVDTYLNVLTAQTALYNAQLTRVSVRLARLTNLVDRYRSLGGGWIERTDDMPRAAETLGSIPPLSSNGFQR